MYQNKLCWWSFNSNTVSCISLSLSITVFLHLFYFWHSELNTAFQKMNLFLSSAKSGLSPQFIWRLKQITFWNVFCSGCQTINEGQISCTSKCNIPSVLFRFECVIYLVSNFKVILSVLWGKTGIQLHDTHVDVLLYLFTDQLQILMTVSMNNLPLEVT
jgi:hypothetical protein